MKKTVEEKYKSMTEVEHILQRSGMWVGSTKTERCARYLYDTETELMTLREVDYVPAMLKIVDEIISNSCDEYRRLDNLGLTKLEVFVNKDTGYISVRDDGGIPVKIHKDAKCYVPEFIFGQLRTSSNYDDTEDRNVIGTNGLGSVLTNIFSKHFIVETADGKNSFHRSWSDNMQTKNDDLKVTKSKEHFTKTEFLIDFNKFEVEGLTDDFIEIIHKRCIDAAAANSGLIVEFKVSDGTHRTWKFDDMEDYIHLYSQFLNMDDVIRLSDNTKKIWVYAVGDLNIGFVNGAECSKGTHIKGIREPISQSISNLLSTKYKIEVSSYNINNKYSLFCQVEVSNPSYTSQTKEELSTPISRFYKDPNLKFDLSKDFIDKCTKSEIVESVLDWYRQKTEAEDAKAIRKLNKDAKKILRCEKFINCNSNKVSEKQLWLFEGDSAKSGFRISRDPETQAAYLLRGNPKNTFGLSPKQVMKNNEFSDIFNILGLQWGERNEPKNLKFGKIVICSDMDADGSKIAALLLVFFNHFSELFEYGMVCRSISPIVIATKGKDIKKYYSLESFRTEQKSLKGYTMKYNKGLGGLSNSEYKEMMRNPIFQVFTKDSIADVMLKKWFMKEGAEERKRMAVDYGSK